MAKDAKEKTTSAQKIFHVLEEAILSGEYVSGTPLIEAKLSLELGVSRTPVREAIRQLELDGLVRVVPNCGAVVIGISEKDIEDIYTIRQKIESLSAGWAAERITQEELDDLKLVLELQEFYLSKKDFSQVYLLDSQFHETINKACRSDVLNSTLSSYHRHIKRARRNSFAHENQAIAAVLEHRAIFDAILQKKTSTAEEKMLVHIENAKERFLQSGIVKG